MFVHIYIYICRNAPMSELYITIHTFTYQINAHKFS